MNSNRTVIALALLILVTLLLALRDRGVPGSGETQSSPPASVPTGVSHSPGSRQVRTIGAVRSSAGEPYAANDGATAVRRAALGPEVLAAARAAALAAAKERQEAEEERLRVGFYSPHLAHLGLTPEQTEAVLARLGALRKTAVANGETLLELKSQRQLYDTEMRTLLGEEGYQSYRQVEALKAFQAEVTREILPLAVEKGVSIDEPTQRMLVSLLAKHGVTTWEVWDGPYDPLPRPGIGAAAAMEHTDRMLSQLQSLDQFLAEATASLPRDVFTTVAEYFQQQKSTLLSSKAVLGMPAEERLSIERAADDELRRKLEERIREKP